MVALSSRTTTPKTPWIAYHNNDASETHAFQPRTIKMKGTQGKIDKSAKLRLWAMVAVLMVTGCKSTRTGDGKNSESRPTPSEKQASDSVPNSNASEKRSEIPYLHKIQIHSTYGINAKRIRILALAVAAGEEKPYTCCRFETMGITKRGGRWQKAVQDLYDRTNLDHEALFLVWGMPRSNVRCVDSIWYLPDTRGLLIFVHEDRDDSDVGYAGDGALVRIQRFPELKDLQGIAILDVESTESHHFFRKPVVITKAGKLDTSKLQDPQYVERFNGASQRAP